LWIRRSLGNLIGNYRVLASSINRSRGDKSLEEEFEKFENYDNFILFKEDLTNWRIASPKENKFEWNDNRVQKFQYVIEKRVLDLYHKILDDLEFEQWNKHGSL
jgi:hypothetical protein